ncbi:MAG: crossover junction endodeoxyribonuclease RuvC [Thiofilum sp.]|uniref:crossover junction endodeoxyribonuclease RuvC n=1 Tax=Thiofilum sp. TaxID=2212733 RepID=UPI0025E867B7|nr:crossover junction endodeoxyribonuclease RuvC [Thiofilum sp.]
MTSKRIMGIDPGSRFTGVGIVDSDGQRLLHVHSDCIKLGDRPIPERLGMIFNGITDLIKLYQPDELAIESIFVATNAGGALKLGQARGAAICAAVVNHLSVHEYSPREVKQATVGKGSADKTQVQHMVKYLLNLHGKLQADSADALAVAICHSHASHLNNRIQQAGWQ